MTWVKPFVAEFLGTFYLCFAGIAAILCDYLMGTNGFGLLGIALAHGLALSVAVNNFGGISGAHFNPAVTIGMLATGRIGGAAAGRYIGAQLLGATTAAALCLIVFPEDAVINKNLGIPLPGAGFSTGVVLLVEFILTFLLVTAVFGTAVDESGKAVKIGAFGIGLTVTFDILAGAEITGASMNPARSFGPALAYWYWDWHFYYWLAPILGGVTAALLYHHVLLAPDEESESPGETSTAD